MIPALTIRQPWAWAIAHADKRVENRGWTVSHRGVIAIHAARSLDARDVDLVARVAGVPQATVLAGAKVRGAVIAVARLTGICRAGWGCDCGPWAAINQFHWRLEHIRPLSTPVPCPGARGLWTLPPDVHRQVLRQVPDLTLA